MLSVTFPALAVILVTLNFSADFDADSLYVAAGRAGAPDASAALPTPIATTMAPAMILLLRTLLASIRYRTWRELRTTPRTGSEYAARPGELVPPPLIVKRGDVHALGGGMDHPVRRERDPHVDDAGLGRLAFEVRRAEEEQVAGLDILEVDALRFVDLPRHLRGGA